MSKRKKKSNAPNIPKATLDRARRQAAGEDVDAELEAERNEEERKARREERRAARKRNQQFDQAAVSNRRERERLDVGAVEQALISPTKVVTEEDLREEYSYVLSDLRNMGLLAGALMVMLVLLAQFI